MRANPKKQHSAFKTTRDGTRIFFPWWMLGAGYEVPSEALCKEIERYRRITTFLDLFVIGFTAAAWRTHMDGVFRYGGILLLLALLAHYVIKVRGWTHGLKKSDVPLFTAAERRANIANQHPAKPWIALICGLLFFAFCVLMLVLTIDTGDLGITLLTGFLALIGLAISCAGVWAVVLRWRVLRHLEADVPQDLG
ncbi:hypothetical protein [Pelagibius marinus]|uniref:hypothetical protein n=1 Tax=Pelagibius marinus TaxID=2762760 RepID=UPI001872CE29|nr:hypothetical protein [Pelagibius marinus]